VDNFLDKILKFTEFDAGFKKVIKKCQKRCKKLLQKTGEAIEYASLSRRRQNNPVKGVELSGNGEEKKA
jgi:hypothetical protein